MHGRAMLVPTGAMLRFAPLRMTKGGEGARMHGRAVLVPTGAMLRIAPLRMTKCRTAA
ncbi:MAG: hypothetical protein IJL83_06155 [Clostridia bacterium]|nr:hypothetical protein [Clostridia bacterium]